MEVGAVGFKNESIIPKLHVEKKNDVLKRIQKTKQEAYPDLQKEHD